MNKPTPGPWIVDEESVTRADAARGLRMVEDGDGHQLMLLQQLPEIGPQEFAANARLIESAPDLLAFCERMEADTWFLLLSDELATMLRAALAKARGDEE